MCRTNDPNLVPGGFKCEAIKGLGENLSRVQWELEGWLEQILQGRSCLDGSTCLQWTYYPGHRFQKKLWIILVHSLTAHITAYCKQ